MDLKKLCFKFHKISYIYVSLRRLRKFRKCSFYGTHKVLPIINDLERNNPVQFHDKTYLRYRGEKDLPCPFQLQIGNNNPNCKSDQVKREISNESKPVSRRLIPDDPSRFPRTSWLLGSMRSISVGPGQRKNCVDRTTSPAKLRRKENGRKRDECTRDARVTDKNGKRIVRIGRTAERWKVSQRGAAFPRILA